MLKVIKNMKLSKNFSLSEFVCKEGKNEVYVDMKLVEKLQELRDKLGRSINIVSGYRSPSYNAKVKGSKNSRHMEGDAADIKVPGLTPEEVAREAEKIGFDGIGVYDTFTHVDTRGYKARWGKDFKKQSPKVQKKGSTYFVEVEPMDMKISIQKKAANKINLENFVTPGFQNTAKMEPVSILVSEGKVIHNSQPNAYVKDQVLPAGTLIVYKDGTVDVKRINDITREIKPVWFAVGGCMVLPDINLVKEGFVGEGAAIARNTIRPVIGWNPEKKKIIIAIRQGTTIERGQLTLKNLGCSKGITLDAGGSACFRVGNKNYYSTNRWLYSVITW